MYRLQTLGTGNTQPPFQLTTDRHNYTTSMCRSYSVDVTSRVSYEHVWLNGHRSRNVHKMVCSGNKRRELQALWSATL